MPLLAEAIQLRLPFRQLTLGCYTDVKLSQRACGQALERKLRSLIFVAEPSLRSLSGSYGPKFPQKFKRPIRQLCRKSSWIHLNPPRLNIVSSTMFLVFSF